MTQEAVSGTATIVPKEKLEDVMTIRFKGGDFARIDAVAGKNRRAKFIREAVEAELKRRERQKPKPSRLGS